MKYRFVFESKRFQGYVVQLIGLVFGLLGWSFEESVWAEVVGVVMLAVGYLWTAIGAAKAEGPLTVSRRKARESELLAGKTRAMGDLVERYKHITGSVDWSCLVLLFVVALLGISFLSAGCVPRIYLNRNEYVFQNSTGCSVTKSFDVEANASIEGSYEDLFEMPLPNPGGVKYFLRDVPAEGGVKDAWYPWLEGEGWQKW